MEYEMEALLPIVANLAKKYTSNESSSIPYETASMLMEAVIYCMDECYERNMKLPLSNGDKMSPRKLYETGYEYVIEKTYKAKELYERVIENFEDYGCKNYRDTITKGIPGFFRRYDPKFQPQDHILTLDYPTLFMNFESCGVDLICEYLAGVEKEKRFLDLFPSNHVCQLLEKIQTEYQSLYLDNICNPVLLHAVGCVIADQPLQKLKIDSSDCKMIEFYFKKDDMETVEQKIMNIIRLITDKMGDFEVQAYFVKISKEFAVRIWNAFQNGALERVF